MLAVENTFTSTSHLVSILCIGDSHGLIHWVTMVQDATLSSWEADRTEGLPSSDRTTA